MAKLVDLQHRWALEIGRVFIAFGSVEGITHECLRHVPSDPLYPATAKMQLGPRIDLLLAILSSRGGEVWERLATQLRIAKELVESRNLIAHNPLGLDVYENEQGDLEMVERIRSLRSTERHISFEELVKLREQSEALASNLYAACGAVRRLKEREQSGRAV